MNPPARNSFHQQLKNSRLEADQNEDVMAVLLNMSTEDYRALESWKYPDSETLKRLCVMMDWNHHDIQRLIINEMISPQRLFPVAEKDPAEKDPADHASSASSAPPPQNKEGFKHQTLGERLREVRMVTGQSAEILALMLSLEEDDYLRLEEGMQPSDAVLRHISMIYNWNYQDLISVLRAEHAKSFQPARVGMPFLGATAQMSRLRKISREMEGVFIELEQNDQQSVLAQLELVRDTILRMRKTS